MEVLEAMKTIGSRLKKRRIDSRLKVADLAERVGVSRSTISKLENGGNVSLAHLLKAMKVLGVLNQIDNFLPEPEISPRDIVKLKKKPNPQRVRDRKSTQEEWTW